MNRKQPRLARWPAALGLALAACSQPSESPPLAGAAIGGDFALVDASGARVTDEDLEGGPHLVYFGYTYCPDICPVDVDRLARAYRIIEEKRPDLAERLTPVFISIDPARDTPAVVGEFAHQFHPDIVALTGTQQAVDEAVAAYRVYAARAGDIGSGAEGGGYLMDHSTYIYLMDAAGAPVNFYDRSMDAAAIAEDVIRWVG